MDEWMGGWMYRKTPVYIIHVNMHVYLMYRCMDGWIYGCMHYVCSYAYRPMHTLRFRLKSIKLVSYKCDQTWDLVT